MSNTVHGNNDVRLQPRNAPHKTRCEMSRRSDLFSEFVAGNGRLEGSNYARRSQPHVCVRKDLSWAFSIKKGCHGDEKGPIINTTKLASAQSRKQSPLGPSGRLLSRSGS